MKNKVVWPTIRTSVRNKLVAGTLALIPVVITYYFLRAFIGFFDRIINPMLEPYLGFHIPGLGLIISLLAIYLLGLFITNILGRSLLTFLEKWLNYIPLVRTVYQTSKQIASAFSLTQTGFERVVFVEYPRTGAWTLGFVTGQSKGKDGTDFIHLFLPTTPNPTSGWALFVPEDDVIPTEMTVEQGLKALISGGALTPPVTNLYVRPKK
ncbi:DUF502 domain-containing protein [bacterium]|nr:DUF502 domain-containing protein [bacterium]MBU1063664.1 DUF502 domain-containing protein [bacterium]MBU1635420.1 DUF502 domain-containing protein [bacterium]MBU1874404.1 DUF502 domain-containing protein [bacterium]